MKINVEITRNLYTICILFSSFIFYLSIVEIKNTESKNKYNIRKISGSNLDYSNINILNKNHIILLGENEYIYVTNAIDEQGELFIESSSEDSKKERYVTGLYKNGRNYFEISIVQQYIFNEKLKRRTGNSIVINSNNKKYLLSICNEDGYFEILDLSSLDSQNNLYKENDDIVENSINSNINSLFKLKNENYFLFAYFHRKGTPGFYKYYLILIKGLINVEDNNFSYITTLIRSDIKTLFSNTLSCFETTDYINCFYLNLEKYLAISVFDQNFNTIIDSILEENSDTATTEDIFRKGIFLKNEISAYIYFLNDAIRPKLMITIGFFI